MKRMMVACLIVLLSALTCSAGPKESTVFVSVDLGGGAKASGTGVVIGNEGGKSLVLTAAHVVQSNDRPISVTYWSDGKPYVTDVSMLAIDSKADVCLLQLDHPVSAVELASAIPSPGEQVETYGFGGTSSILTPLHKTGTVTTGPSWVMPMTDHTIHLVQGDSGSGLFNKKGELVGLNHSAYMSTGLAADCATVHKFTVTTLKSKRVLFPRLHDRLAAKQIMKAIQKATPKQEAPKQASAPPATCTGASCQTRTFRFFRR